MLDCVSILGLWVYFHPVVSHDAIIPSLSATKHLSRAGVTQSTHTNPFVLGDHH
jgi:hypothetical protein